MRGLQAVNTSTRLVQQASNSVKAGQQVADPPRRLPFITHTKTTLISLGAAASLLLSTAAHAAPDAAKVGTCLLQNCQSAVLGCVEDANCLKNLVCLQNCNGAPDVTACQIRCGDLYDDKAIATFNACAISQQKCVPQRVDEGLFPVPPDCALDTKFDLGKFTGRWYITAGLNPLFDTFDCQVHYFDVPSPGKLTGEINWRIKKPYGDFSERQTIQKFVQQANPALLLNRGNEYLHYEDDWYILASKPNEYVFIYYRGNNDAWKGYGGAVVYTRAASLPEKYVPELRAAAEAAGIDWSKMVKTDNTCPKHPKTALQRLDTDIQALDERFEGSFKSFGKGFTVLEGNLLKELTEEEQRLAQELVVVEKAFEGLEKNVEQKLESGLETGAAEVAREIRDGRAALLATLLLPAAGWVTFNIAGPALNQMRKMQDRPEPPRAPAPTKRKVGSKTR